MRNQTNQMPAAWMYDWETPEGEFIQNMTTDDFGTFAGNHVGRITNIRPLYLGPFFRPWMNLSQQEGMDIALKNGFDSKKDNWIQFLLDIQAELMRKNA